MPHKKTAESRCAVKLTAVQRRLVAKILPALWSRLKLDEPNQRIVDLSLAEAKAVKEKASLAIRRARTGYERRPLRLVIQTASHALDRAQRAPNAGQVYQLKISLPGTRPLVWRRIQVKDCTLDKLHEHIQTALGWTNSHLHHFKFGEQFYGDPELMQKNLEEFDYKYSTATMMSTVLREIGDTLQYEYDFGDGWQHEIVFEGILLAEPKRKYPICLDGARACPPEECGGIWGYANFLHAIADPDDERHDELLEWIGGKFDPEAFNADKTTKAMRNGLPDWRSELWV